MTRLQDRLLVRRMLAGEDRAFEDFFAVCFPALFRFAMRRLNRDSDAAAEVVQRALCKAVTKLQTYRGDAALLTWLCTFCRHEISAYLRYQIRQMEYLEESGLEHGWAFTQDQSELRREAAQTVQAVMSTLPPRYAEALEWKYIEGASVKDIAGRLNVREKAAESLLTRARQAFREAFRSLCSRATKEGTFRE